MNVRQNDVSRIVVNPNHKGLSGLVEIPYLLDSLCPVIALLNPYN